MDLKKLNSVYKKDYVKMVLSEDDKVKEHLVQIDKKCTDKNNEL